MATGESFKLDGLLLPVYLFRRLLCSPCEIEDPCAAARFAVGSADRLLAVYLVQFVRLAAKRLVGKSLQLHKKYAGLLLNSIKHAKSILKQNLILGKVATLGPQSLTFMRQPTCM